MSQPVTPHTANPSILLTSTSTPATGTGAGSQLPSTPSLPSPSDFDILPDTHRLLSRLIHTAGQQPPTETPGPQNQKEKDENAPLEIQQLATEAGQLRNKIRNARRKVLELPDVDRSVEEQEEEIKWLEDRIEGLKDVLKGLGRPTSGLSQDGHEVVMAD